MESGCTWGTFLSSLWPTVKKIRACHNPIGHQPDRRCRRSVSAFRAEGRPFFMPDRNILGERPAFGAAGMMPGAIRLGREGRPSGCSRRMAGPFDKEFVCGGRHGWRMFRAYADVCM